MQDTAPQHHNVCGIALRRCRRAVTGCLSLVLALAIGTTAGAQSIVQQKILAGDARALDRFGFSVAISGNSTIVGAPGGELLLGEPLRSGFAYVFDVTSGSQLSKLIPADGAAKDEFGFSVAISGDKAIVGSPFHDDLGNESGAAYVFDTTTGSQLFKLTAGADARVLDFFGTSVAIDRNMAIVGAPFDEDVISAAYLFDVNSGERLMRLTSRLMAADDQFGRSVGISGNRAIVGADRGSSSEVAGGVELSGTVYLFDVDPQSPNFGQELFKLSAADADSADFFGNSVAISGNRAIVGAFRDDDAGTSSGSAYVFDVTTGEQLFKLTASDAAERDRFGTSVSISGNLAIVGAPGNFSELQGEDGRHAGSAYLFDVMTGEELARFTASDMADGDFFGFVGIDNGTAIVGAPGNDDLGSATGAAYLLTDLPQPIPEPSSLLLATLALLMIRRPPACRGD